MVLDYPWSKYSANFPPPCATQTDPWKDDLNILHFNDVYEIKAAKREPVGGAARFCTKLQEYASENPLVLFSGDALNPSLISTVTKGVHMIDFLNKMGVHAAVVGNHDLDYGVENLQECIQLSDFPWICTNATFKDSGLPLAGAEEYVVLTHAGKRIGVLGLIEEDWFACCSTIDPDSVAYTDFVAKGRELAAKLKSEGKVDLVIALTHFREPNDERLAREAPEIDLILGGHDHHYAAHQVEPHGLWYVKSGTDFKTLSRVVMTRPGSPGRRPGVAVEKLEVTSATAEDPAAREMVEECLGKLKASMGKVLGEVGVEMDARFSSVRSSETNMGNFVADVLRLGCRSDIGLCTSGTLRADAVYPVGDFTVEDLVKLLPFLDDLNVVAIRGADFVQVLENGVSQYPKLEGRFPQVSGVAFQFDPAREPGARVVPGSVLVGGAALDPAREYTVATAEFVAKGKDGYDAFKKARVVMDGEMCPMLPTLVRNHLTCLQVLSSVNSMKLQKRKTLTRAVSLFKGESQDTPEERATLKPKIEGRIVNVSKLKVLGDLPPIKGSLSGQMQHA